MSSPSDALTSSSAGQRISPVSFVAAVAVVGALAASYGSNLIELQRRWSHDPNYSFGYLVAPIALAILWQRRGELDPTRLRPRWYGWPVLIGLLALRLLLFQRNEFWMESLTMVPALAALALAFGGWHLLRWAAPAIGFLLFLLPIPPSLNMTLAGPLQTLATIGSTSLLQAMGLPVLAEGNIIYIGAEQLEVAQVCNGLSMLVSFVTLITAATIMMARDRPIPERVLLLASTIPIALISNIIRIAATAWAYHLLGAKRGEAFAHDTMGWAMMPIGLVLIWLELKAFSWVFVEEEADSPKLVIPTVPPPRMPSKPQKPRPI